MTSIFKTEEEESFFRNLRGNYARAESEGKRMIFLDLAYAIFFRMFPGKLEGLDGDELVETMKREKLVSV